MQPYTFYILGDKWDQHSYRMLVWMSSILDQNHPLSGTDPSSLGTWCSITRLILGRWGLFALVGCSSRRGDLR